MSLHAAFELTLGMAVTAAPFVLGFGAAGILAGVFIGTTLMGLALAGIGSGDRGTVSARAHALYDRALAAALLIAAALLALAGDDPAAAFLAVAGVAQVGLVTSTRYTADA